MRVNRCTAKTTVFVALAATTALLLSACASSGVGSDAATLSDEPVTLSFTWWGNDLRTAATNEVIAAFEAECPNITIEGQFSDWAGYWDKLATATAANDTPDIMQMDEKYIATYGERGALLDLDTTGDAIDLSEFPESALATGEIDGGRYGIPTALNSQAIMVNPDLFEQAGVPLPDDENWTWDDFKQLGAQISAGGGGDVFGVQTWGFEDGSLRTWARQAGDSLYTDGEVSIKTEAVQDWYEYMLAMVDEGVMPPASTVVEKLTAGQAESMTATNRAGMGTWWNSQLTALADSSGAPLQIMRVPTPDGGADGSAYYKTSMFWSVSSRTEHPAEAALFLDYLANSETAGDIMLTERGVPANEKIREHIKANLSPNDVAVVEFLDNLADDIGEVESVTPAGASAMEGLLSPFTEQVLFGQATPAQAAEGFVAALKSAVAAG
ncbi:ABC transporter substrate-binding protein [Cryobacterium sp. Y50]|uniref:ABC transporter substrate-binding protein n=1 Tax=Cryobacterium sp. Y50 TaxID=2048286 RepID=UPI001E3472AC|nr:sugar ABC transporter substrate-binding protein [Cryobacterium sp. Y50]